LNAARKKKKKNQQSLLFIGNTNQKLTHGLALGREFLGRDAGVILLSEIGTLFEEEKGHVFVHPQNSPMQRREPVTETKTLFVCKTIFF